MEEWVDGEGKRVQAYHAKMYTCPGCEAIESAFSADTYNAREAGVTSHGRKAKLITPEQLASERDAR